VLRLVRAIDRQRKPLGAICHAGWVLCSADVLRGRTITCFSAIRDDVVNAGARYVDRAVVRDGHVVTARKPDDLPAFMKEFLRGLERAAEGSRRQRRQEGLRGARQHNRPNRRAVL